MTCAQGLLRLLWGGPEVGVLRDWILISVLISLMDNIYMIICINKINLRAFVLFGDKPLLHTAVHKRSIKIL